MSKNSPRGSSYTEVIVSYTNKLINKLSTIAREIERNTGRLMNFLTIVEKLI